MNSKKIGLPVVAFIAAAGIGSLPAGDAVPPPAGQAPAAAAPAAQPAAQPAAKPLEAGDVAPAFSLTGSDGKTYSLAEFKGKKTVVVAWFPKAFTGG